MITLEHSGSDIRAGTLVCVHSRRLASHDSPTPSGSDAGIGRRDARQPRQEKAELRWGAPGRPPGTGTGSVGRVWYNRQRRNPPAPFDPLTPYGHVVDVGIRLGTLWFLTFFSGPPPMTMTSSSSDLPLAVTPRLEGGPSPEAIAPARKILITGAAGFIGCHAASRFAAAGWRVLALDNLSRPGCAINWEWLKTQGVTDFLRLDVRDAQGLLDVVTRHHDLDAVLHLAGQVAVTQSVRDPRADFEHNALGTLNVLEAVRLGAGGRPVVLYASTNKIYGALEDVDVRPSSDGKRYRAIERPLGINERQPLKFHSPYGCSKGAGDQYVRDYAKIFDMKTVSMVQSCIYGTRQMGVEDQGWVAHFMIAAQLGRPLTIYGDGLQVRDLLWVDDLIDGYARALERAGEPGVKGQGFNLGGGPERSLSLLELVDHLEARLKRRPEVRFDPWRPGDQKVFIADTQAARRQLDWEPRVGVEEGLERLWSWVAAHLEDLRDFNAGGLKVAPALSLSC